MSEHSGRPWLAALLALLVTGLGHVYLREWLRALAWFGLAVTTAVLVVPPDAMTGAEPFDFGAVQQVVRSLSTEATAALFLVRVLSAVDAYLVARGVTAAEHATGGATANPGDADATGATGATETGTCPNCGEDLDEDLDFCPWCTERLDDGTDDGEGGATSR